MGDGPGRAGGKGGSVVREGAQCGWRPQSYLPFQKVNTCQDAEPPVASLELSAASRR